MGHELWNIVYFYVYARNERRESQAGNVKYSAVMQRRSSRYLWKINCGILKFHKRLRYFSDKKPQRSSGEFVNAYWFLKSIKKIRRVDYSTQSTKCRYEEMALTEDANLPSDLRRSHPTRGLLVQEEGGLRRVGRRVRRRVGAQYCSPGPWPAPLAGWVRCQVQRGQLAVVRTNLFNSHWKIFFYKF